MECTECREIVSAALDDEATRDELKQADRHLAGCGKCRAYRDDLAADRSLLRQWPNELPGDRPLRRRFGMRRLAAAAMIVLAVGTAFVAGRATSPERVVPPDFEQTSAGESDVLVRQESMQYYPDSNETHSTVVLVVDGRVKG